MWHFSNSVLNELLLIPALIPRITLPLKARFYFPEEESLVKSINILFSAHTRAENPLHPRGFSNYIKPVFRTCRATWSMFIWARQGVHLTCEEGNGSLTWCRLVAPRDFWPFSWGHWTSPPSSLKWVVATLLSHSRGGKCFYSSKANSQENCEAGLCPLPLLSGIEGSRPASLVLGASRTGAGSFSSRSFQFCTWIQPVSEFCGLETRTQIWCVVLGFWWICFFVCLFVF